YRRFILHYASICAAAGGVDAFCIGSEMRSLTQIRGDNGSFPVVQELIELAAEARVILGPDTKISYAADWSEYFGYHPQDGSGDVFFHLDPLWADDEIDFIGIDNYMPLSDWRDGRDHADVSWGSIYDPSYLKSNIAGGEGFDWYYKSKAAEELQVRTPITDGAYGEPWVFRYKDLRSWWSYPHFERIGGIRQSNATAWLPGSKPFWFTEIGCAATDKGSNQPNKFLDPKSSESALPKFSNGARDDLIQMQYLRAMSEFWADPANNPDSTLYPGRMVDTDRQFAWAWDARPFPHFPGNQTLWSDGENYARGHWLTGRMSARSLASVIKEICARSGVSDVDVSNVYGFVRGFRQRGDESARESLQALLMAGSVDVAEKSGLLVFKNRSTFADIVLGDSDLAELGDGAVSLQSREPQVEIPDRVRLNFLEADGDYEIRAQESVYPGGSVEGIAQSELPLVLTQSEGLAAAERWLSEVRVGRDTATFAVPPSVELKAGNVVEMDTEGVAGLFRIDRIEEFGLRKAEAVRIEPGVYERTPVEEPIVPTRPVTAPLPVWPVIMDLPLLRGDEDAEAPWVAATAAPWPGQVAVYGSNSGSSWGYEVELSRRAIMGETLTELKAADVGVWDRAGQLEVGLTSGVLSSISDFALFSGGNVALVGHPSISGWEIFQFRDATLIDQGVWALEMRLRGQRGTDGVIPDLWPIGSTVVIVDQALRQIPIAPSQRGVEREYRIGPASKPVDHPAYQTLSHVADGVGLRPYRPVHIQAHRYPTSDIRISWVRQTRIDGDFWGALDVPLGEASESYQLRVVASGATRREEIISASEWIYTVADQSADGISGAFSFEVAQISDRFGPGLAGKVIIDV
ncbi:MAG: baseplate multidomain protein megatron, partial [Boseongicola sp.]